VRLLFSTSRQAWQVISGEAASGVDGNCHFEIVRFGGGQVDSSHCFVLIEIPGIRPTIFGMEWRCGYCLSFRIDSVYYSSQIEY
jgi:hypothetical protein